MANSLQLSLDAVSARPARPPAAMVRAMREGGWFGPLGVVRPRPDGRYELICGGRRVAAARATGWRSGDFVVARGDVDAALLRLRENACRADNPAAAFRDVLALSESGMSYTEISRATGITRSQIAKLMRLRSLLPELMARLEAGEISANLAFEAATLPLEDQRSLAADPRPTIPKVRALRTARLRAASPVVAEPSSPPPPPPSPLAAGAQAQLPAPAVWAAIRQLAADVRDGIEPAERLVDLILRAGGAPPAR